MEPLNLLLACSGSVASIKLNLLLEKLQLQIPNINVKVILTQHSLHFTGQLAVTDSVQCYTDEDEWKTWNKMGDDILHIELGKWAHAMLIAPLSANSLAKIATGICDNLLTCTVRAWDMKKPLLFAPAMNTRMLDHPITGQQIQTLTSWGYTLIPPVEKLLACGERGSGAMAEVGSIVQTVLNATHSS